MNGCILPIRRWYAWAPGLAGVAAWQQWAQQPGADLPAETAAAPVDFVEPMLRRRLSPLSRVALHCAHVALAGERAEQLVFASRHGELGTTVNLLRQLAQGEALSPMGFSLSVHNSAAGLYGIAARDATPATAIAAGRDSLQACLIEAAALRACGIGSVLISYVEQDLPAVYQAWQEPEAPLLGLGLLIADGGTPLQLSRDVTSASYLSPAVALIRALAVAQPATLMGEQHSWALAYG
ncbi:MAG: beta-ketoacyl synthase chain length factor [Pseudomonadota bacterium]